MVCANCLEKSQILKGKRQKAKPSFLTPSVSKKAKFVKFGVKKANLATLVAGVLTRARPLVFMFQAVVWLQDIYC